MIKNGYPYCWSMVGAFQLTDPTFHDFAKSMALALLRLS